MKLVVSLGIFLLMTNPFFCLAQSDSSLNKPLLSERELNREPIYTNLLKAFRNYENVYRLKLQNSGGVYGKIDAIHPKIDSLENLQYFYVVNENLQNLPPSFGKLQKLQYLYLSGNFFNAIPDTVFSLKNLKVMYFSRNDLRALPDKIAKLEKLEALYLDDNKELDFIPVEAIARLTRLKLINLSGTAVPKEQIALLRKKMTWARIEY